MSLEAGGLIIGWFNIIVQFFILFGIISLMSLAVVAYNEGNNPSNDDVIGGFVSKFKCLFVLSVLEKIPQNPIFESFKEFFQCLRFIFCDYSSFDDRVFILPSLYFDRIYGGYHVGDWDKSSEFNEKNV